MALLDWPLEQLQSYKPSRQEPANFEAFWQQTLHETRAHPLDVRLQRVNYGLQTLETFDLEFSGYGGQRIKGWLMLPKGAATALPCVVEFIGYGGGRGFPLDWLTWASAGFAHLVMDTRGQGSRWRKGDTPDLAPDGDNPQHPGFMTRGVLSPNTYYYRRLIADAVRAVEVAQQHPAINPQRIALTGRSQGGGLALIASGLTQVAAVMPDVPFLCHYRRATTLIDTAPYNEIATFCKIHREQAEQVFSTLDYFDGVNFAPRSKAKALFSVGLMDDICPPSTVFAAYNHYAGPKEIKVWPFNNHEGGETFQVMAQLRFLADWVG